MATELAKYLCVAISSRALFDLELEDKIYKTGGLDEYTVYQIQNENKILKPGTGFPLVTEILRINKLLVGKRKTEVIVISRNNAATSLRIFNSIEHYGLDISKAAFTSGASVSKYLKAFDVDLFLSAEEEDVRNALNAKIAAGIVYKNTFTSSAPVNQIRVAFDGDAVLFSDESERIYREKGLEEFLRHEKVNAKRPLPDGPFAKLCRSISYLQAEFGLANSPIRTALITARNDKAKERVIHTLRAWNVRIDECFFLGDVKKNRILEVFQPHIFFDDQHVNCELASKCVPTARVPYGIINQIKPDKPLTNITLKGEEKSRLHAPRPKGKPPSRGRR